MNSANLTPNVASSIQKTQIANEAAMAVARKSLQAQQAQGEAAVDLVQQAAAVGKQISQGRIDVRL